MISTARLYLKESSDSSNYFVKTIILRWRNSLLINSMRMELLVLTASTWFRSLVQLCDSCFLWLTIKLTNYHYVLQNLSTKLLVFPANKTSWPYLKPHFLKIFWHCKFNYKIRKRRILKIESNNFWIDQ